MDKKKALYAVLGITGIAIVAFVVISYINWSATPGDLNEFAQCLTANGVVMYGTEWCHNCKNQKDMFGTSFQFVNYVDCDQQKSVCNSEGVTGYPTWKINGLEYRGTQQLQSLASASNCNLQ
ncbi:MAG: hypothetical protein V1672_00890 [Candidatus Diapherotrites archaeon]